MLENRQGFIPSQSSAPEPRRTCSSTLRVVLFITPLSEVSVGRRRVPLRVSPHLVSEFFKSFSETISIIKGASGAPGTLSVSLESGRKALCPTEVRVMSSRSNKPGILGQNPYFWTSPE